jgi:hypothetical protein
MENIVLILTAVLAFTWLAGAVLVWRSLLLQERLHKYGLIESANSANGSRNGLAALPPAP